MKSLSLALRRRIYTAVTDLRYGGRFLRDNGIRPAGFGGNSGYDVLPTLFRERVRDNDVLVDVGCGKGRVLNWWLAHYPKHQIYGIELEQSVAEQTRNRLQRYNNVKIIISDACSLIPADGSLFYLFNPFDTEVMQRFILELIKSPRAANGLVRRIIYHNCTCVNLFRDHPKFLVQDITSVQNSHPCALIELVSAVVVSPSIANGDPPEHALQSSLSSPEQIHGGFVKPPWLLGPG
jgi:SAM-dependent methyltransferase